MVKIPLFYIFHNNGSTMMFCERNVSQECLRNRVEINGYQPEFYNIFRDCCTAETAASLQTSQWTEV
jgi:hypothetical protein